MGKFIVFEGIDRCGKSTQIKQMGEWLTKNNIENIVVQEPGSTLLGKTLRNILKNNDIPCCPEAQKALFTAARIQLIEEIIKPALERGLIVLCDRYVLSTWCYQIFPNITNHTPAESFINFVKEFCATPCLIKPDLTVVFDIHYQTYLDRNRNIDITKDRFEANENFMAKVMKGYRFAYNANTSIRISNETNQDEISLGKMVSINANMPMEHVTNCLTEIFEKFII